MGKSILKDLLHGGRQAVNKARGTFDAAKYNNSISYEEKKKKELYEIIGKKYCAYKLRNKDFDVSDELNKLEEINRRIRFYQSRVASIRNVRICYICGNIEKGNATYCSVCGSKFEAKNEAIKEAGKEEIIEQSDDIIKEETEIIEEVINEDIENGVDDTEGMISDIDDYTEEIEELYEDKDPELCSTNVMPDGHYKGSYKEMDYDIKNSINVKV